MSSCCKKGCALVILFISFFFLLISGISYLNQKEVSKELCQIKNVTYPESLSDISNLVSCNCGRRCTSEAGTCIRIFGNINDNNTTEMMFLPTVSTKNDNGGCTFYENKCANGEKIEDRMEAVSQAKKKAEKYIQIMNSNEYIECYYSNSKNQIYLSNSDYNIQLIIAATLFILIIFLNLCCFCISCDNHEDSSRNYAI